MKLTFPNAAYSLGTAILIACSLTAQEDKEAKERQSENQRIAAELPDGPGKTIMVARCVDCHSLARVTSGRKSLVSWKNTIQVMVANGAVFEDKEIDPLAQYLAANFPLPVNVNSATTAELGGVPGLTPEVAAAIVRDREANGKFNTLQDLTRVQGVTGELLKKIASRLTVGVAAR